MSWISIPEVCELTENNRKWLRRWGAFGDGATFAFAVHMAPDVAIAEESEFVAEISRLRLLSVNQAPGEPW